MAAKRKSTGSARKQATARRFAGKNVTRPPGGGGRRPPRPATVDPDYSYRVVVVGGRVVIEGTNDGNIRGDAGEPVRFEFDARGGGTGFTIEATNFKKNKNKGDQEKRNPFGNPLPAEPVTQFESPLNFGAGSGNLKLFKYTVRVAVAANQQEPVPADPAIIIDRS